MIDKETFESPPMQYRPLQIVHDMGLHADLGLEECQRRIRERLQRLKQLGFGGVVANVSHQDYLTDETNFQIFGEVLNEAEREGFCVWLYDEKGYPSGSFNCASTLCENRQNRWRNASSTRNFRASVTAE